jgi:ribose transport system substrate-binding protein
MKIDRVYTVLLTIMICAFIGTYIFLSRSHSTDVKELENKPRIVLLSHVYNNPYWHIVKKGAEEAAQKRGCVVEYNGPQAASVKESLRLLDMAIAAKVDGILTYVQEEEQYIPVINKAIEKGIPVVTIDTDAPRSKRIAYIGTDNIKAGKVAAEVLVKKVGGKGKIGVVMGGRTTTNQIQRFNGFEEYIKAYPNMRVVAVESSNSYTLEAELVTKKILRENRDLVAIFCTSALDGMGAAKAIIDLKKQNEVTIICFDDLPETLEYIKKGIIYASIVQRPYEMGYGGVNMIMDIIEGKKVPEENLTGIIVVKKENVNTYDKEKGVE